MTERPFRREGAVADQIRGHVNQLRNGCATPREHEAVYAELLALADEVEAYTASTGEPCDGERCEVGGAAHCHRCAEAEADKLLAERDQLRARIAAAEAQVAKHFQIASRYVGEGSTWAITAQALHAVDRALGGIQVTHDLHGLAGGVISFPAGADAEDMERFRVAWDEAAGPERALTLNVEHRTATFRAKPWPHEYSDAWTCVCRYMNTGPICTHCGKLREGAP